MKTGREVVAPPQGVLSVTESWKRSDTHSFLPGISRRNQPWQHLHLRVLVSRTIRGYISLFPTPQSTLVCYNTPKKLIEPVRILPPHEYDLEQAFEMQWKELSWRKGSQDPDLCRVIVKPLEHLRCLWPEDRAKTQHKFGPWRRESLSKCQNNPDLERRPAWVIAEALS